MKRLTNFDVLRCIAIFMVITIHVSAMFFSSTIETNRLAFTITNFYDSISRTAVPLFIILSGFFSLRTPVSIKKHFKKVFFTMIIPAIVWFLIYDLFYKLTHNQPVLSIFSLETLTAFRIYIFSNPGGHLWFMPMFIGVQLLVPLIYLLKCKLKQRTFFILGIVFLILSVLYTFTKFYLVVKTPNPNLFAAFLYLGYFIIGNVILDTPFAKLPRPTYILLFIFGVSLTFFFTQFLSPGSRFLLYSYDYLSVPVILSAISLFIFFSKIKITNNNIISIVNKLTPNIFFVYFVHMIILYFTEKFLSLFFNIKSCLLFSIPLMAVLTLCISFILAEVFANFKKWIVNTKN